MTFWRTLLNDGRVGGKSWIHTESASALDATQCDVHEQTSSGMTALGHDEFFQILDFTLMNEKSIAFVIQSGWLSTVSMPYLG